MTALLGAGEYLRPVTGLPELPPKLTLEQILEVTQAAVHLDSGRAVTAHIIHLLQHHGHSLCKLLCSQTGFAR